MAQMNMVQALNSAMDVMLEPRSRAWSSSARTWATSAACSAAPTACSANYGEHRVLDTPIAEGGIVAAAIGMGVNGLQARGRDPVRRLHLPGLRPDGERAGAAALPHRRANSPRRSPSARPAAAASAAARRTRRAPRHFHPRVRHQGGDAVQPLRRQGPADQRHRGRGPGDVLRAEAHLQRTLRRRPEQAGSAVERRTRAARCPTATTACRSAAPRSCARVPTSPCSPTAPWCTSARRPCG